MKKLILSLFILCSAMGYSQGTIPMPSIIGLPAALAGKVDKVAGKSLIADTSIVKLVGVQPGAQVNTIEGVQKNGVDLSITGKKVNITVPTTAAEIGAQPAGTYSTDIHGNISALNAVSGTNTGDETTATIKTKLGITTLSGANTGDQTSVSGNSGTATKLQTSRTINGVSFDGTQNITINAVDATSRVASSLLGAANGVATLDANGIILTTQLPSYIDDVLEYINLAAFPATGEAGKIYVAKDTNKTYRWSGSVYVYITSGAVDSVNGYTGVVSLSKSDLGLGNLDNTSDANKPISTATQAALNGKQASGTYSTDIHGNITALNAVSGTNTGDETLTSIKTKLGAASSSNAGYLTNTDWTRFDGKQPAGAYLTAITSGQVTGALGYTPWWNSNHPTTVSGYGITDVDVNATDDAIVRRSGSGLAMIIGGYLKTTLANLNAVTPTEIFTGNGDGVIRRSSLSNTLAAFGLNSISTQSTSGLTTNYIPRWNGSSFVNSLISDNGSTIYMNQDVQMSERILRFDKAGIRSWYMYPSANNFELGSGDGLGSFHIINTTQSISPATGSLIVDGGVGIAGDIFSNGTLKNNYINTHRIDGIWYGAAISASNSSGDRVVIGTLGNLATIGAHNSALNSWSNLSINQGGGNVSVGYATDPGYKFSVNGNVYFSNYLQVNGRIFSSSYLSLATSSDDDPDGNPWYGLGRKGGADPVTLNGYFGARIKSSGGHIDLSTGGTVTTTGKVFVTDATQSDMDGTVLNDGAIQTNGGISCVKDINSGANINAYGNLTAYGTVRVAGGTPTQLMTRDGGYVEVSSVASTGGSYSPSISVGSNTANPVVYSALYTKNGTVYSSIIKGYIECTGSQGNTCTFNVSTYNGSTANLSIIGVGAQGTNMIMGSGSTGSNVVVSFTNPVGSGGIGFTLIIHYTN